MLAPRYLKLPYSQLNTTQLPESMIAKSGQKSGVPSLWVGEFIALNLYLRAPIWEPNCGVKSQAI